MIDKPIYSPWPESKLQAVLAARQIDTLVVTGGETMFASSQPFLAPPKSAIASVTDALCSSSDATHYALMTVYHQRFTQQVETVDMETILSAWT